MTETPSERSAGFQALTDNRWVILFFSVLSMVAVANFQYGWTLFVGPLQKHLNVEIALIQVTFTVFVLLETWLVPFEGWLVDKFGPKLLVMIGGVLAGAGWYGSGKADTLSALYISYAISGLGAGVVYGTAIGSALKWFPDHRGLAAGLTAAGFGAGSAFTVAPLANMINPRAAAWFRLPAHVHRVGNYSGRGRGNRCAVPEGAADRLAAKDVEAEGEPRGKGPPKPAGLQTRRNGVNTAFLADVRDDGDGGDGRFDGNGAISPNGQGLQSG